MSSAGAVAERPRTERRESTPSPRKLERLALLYEGLLAVIGRVHSGRRRVDDPEEFRERTKGALREIAALGARRGYTAEDVQEANFAVVALLDEVILTASDSSAADWAGRSLGEELFQQRSAGELFFQHLERLRGNRDSQELAEVLEVYYLCLLLGYEGKFAGGAKGELLQLTSNLRERIERILLRDPQLSPDIALPNEPLQNKAQIQTANVQLRLFAVAALVLAILCYVGFSVQLSTQVARLRHEVGQQVAGGYLP